MGKVKPSARPPMGIIPGRNCGWGNSRHPYVHEQRSGRGELREKNGSIVLIQKVHGNVQVARHACRGKSDQDAIS